MNKTQLKNDICVWIDEFFEPGQKIKIKISSGKEIKGQGSYEHKLEAEAVLSK